MLRPQPGIQAYLYLEPVDMRKSIDGLAILVESELALLGLHEVRELSRNLRHGEHSIDIPARARDTPSLILGARAIDADSAEDARSQRRVSKAGRRVREGSREPNAHASHLAHGRLSLGDHFA